MKKILLFSFIIVFFNILNVSANNAVTNVNISEDEVISIGTDSERGFNDSLSSEFRIEYGSAATQVNPEYIETLRREGIKLPYVRTFLNQISWKKSLGDLNLRGGSESASEGSYASGRIMNYGLAEQILTTRKIDPYAKFVFVVRTTDDIENIKDLVRFLALEPDDAAAVGNDGTNWPQKRIDLGIYKKIDSIIELGNEEDMQYYSSEEELSAGAAAYIERCSRIIDEIRKIKADIKISVLTYTTPHDRTGRAMLWNKPVIGQLGAKADYIAHHYYYHADTVFGEDINGQRLKVQIADLINELPDNSRPKIFISEHAVWVSPNAAYSQKRIPTSLSGALATAEFLARISENPMYGPSIYHSLIGSYSTANSYGSTGWGIFRPYTSDGKLYTSAVGEIYKLLDRSSGSSTVNVETFGNIYCNKQTGRADGIYVTASTTKDGGLNIVAINRNTSISHDLKVTTKNKYRLWKKTVLTGDGADFTNEPGNPEAVYAKTSLVNAENLFSGGNVPAQSVTVFYLVPEGSAVSGGSLEAEVIQPPEDTAESAGGRHLFVNAWVYDNMNLAGNRDLWLSVSDEYGSVKYIGQVKTVKQFYGFDVCMPRDAESGEYTAMIGNGAQGAVEKFKFNYRAPEANNVKQLRIVNAISNGIEKKITNSDGYVKLHIVRDKYAVTDNFVKITVSDSQKTVYAAEHELNSNVGDVEFYLSDEAVPGLYRLSVTADGKTTETEFVFDKKAEVLVLVSRPSIDGKNPVRAEDVKAGDKIMVNIRNAFESKIEFDALLGMYDDSGKLVNLSKLSEVMEADTEKKLEFNVSAGTADRYSYLSLYVWGKGNVSPLEKPYILK